MGVTTGTRASKRPKCNWPLQRVAFNGSHQLLWLVARGILNQEKKRRMRFHREKKLESPLLVAAAAATSSKEPPQCLADSDGTGATQVLVVDHYDLRVERVQGFRQELLRQASEMMLLQSVNVYTHANKHICLYIYI